MSREIEIEKEAHEIPIFGQGRKLVIWAIESKEELPTHLSESDGHGWVVVERDCCDDEYIHIIFHISDDLAFQAGIIAHECLHVLRLIHENTGQNFNIQKGDDEFAGYILQWLVELCHDTLGDKLKALKSKSSKKRKKVTNKTKTAKRTKKAMDDLKKNKKVFTKSMYGWDVKKDGSISPNWREQNNIDWMKEQIGLGFSASAVAKHLRVAGFLGKRGGTWQSANVLRTVRNDFHLSRSDYEAPKWFVERKSIKLRK